MTGIVTSPEDLLLHYVEVARIHDEYEPVQQAVCGVARHTLWHVTKYVECVNCGPCLRWLIGLFSGEVDVDEGEDIVHYSETAVGRAALCLGQESVVCGVKGTRTYSKWVESVTCLSCSHWLVDFFVGQIAASERGDKEAFIVRHLGTHA